jgi:hypothetical protein
MFRNVLFRKNQNINKRFNKKIVKKIYIYNFEMFRNISLSKCFIIFFIKTSDTMFLTKKNLFSFSIKKCQA